MKNTSIERLTVIIEQTLGQLGVTLNPERATQLATNVFDAMSSDSRIYHNLNHVFGFVKLDNPIFTLAALYHDIVYYRVDMGFTPVISKIILPYLEMVEDEFFITRNIPEKDKLIWMTLAVFDLKPGQQIASAGALNEFLSALVVTSEIGEYVSRPDILRILVCIEATIPFRTNNEFGLSPLEQMEAKLGEISAKFCDTVWPTEEIENSIRTAVVFANTDISTFSESDPARFLENTWKLIPEMSSNLRSPELYTIRNYRLALQAMENLLSNLNPEHVFQRYKGTPTVEEFRQMTDFARRNISVSSEYLRVYLVATALLEALAQVSGGDTLLSKFTGKIPSGENHFPHLREFLPEVALPERVVDAPIILDLLSTGCADSDGWDACNSQLSLFVYLYLTPESMVNSFYLAKDLFAGTIGPEKYLRKMDRGLVSVIAQAVGQMDSSRHEQLLAYA